MAPAARRGHRRAAHFGANKLPRLLLVQAVGHQFVGRVSIKFDVAFARLWVIRSVKTEVLIILDDGMATGEPDEHTSRCAYTINVLKERIVSAHLYYVGDAQSCQRIASPAPGAHINRWRWI
jgi:hypothetical protein